MFNQTFDDSSRDSTHQIPYQPTQDNWNCESWYDSS